MNISEEISLTNQKTYHCGTLTYTKVGLFVLFSWLLWGDFCYVIMESVIPSIIPLKLKHLGASNLLIGIIMSTLPGILNTTICPWISFKSDRCRSKWGRRIPFILSSLPFLCICLVMLGFSDDIVVILQKYSESLREHTPATLAIGLIALFIVVFQFFNMFVGSVFYYLANDVVPAQFLGRYMGTFRIIGASAGAMYQFFIFKYAETHMREIFLGAALLYFIGMGLMCLMVKEGEYPPVEGESDKDNKGWGGIKTFLKESYSHKFYWMLFLSSSFAIVGNEIIASFELFFYQNMGLDLDQIGKLYAIRSISIVGIVYFMAIFIDRWHPFRIVVYGTIFGVVGCAINLIWLFVTLPGNYFFWLNIGNTLISAILVALLSVAAGTAQMRIFPKSRYGQFCSAQALMRSVFIIVAGGGLAGAFIDGCKWLFNGSDFAYRFIYLWQTVFLAISAFLLVKVYLMWNKMGGDKSFHPPAPWSPDGVEELPVVKTIATQKKYLKISFLLFDGIMWISALSIPLLMVWMYVHKAFAAFKWYGIIVLPLAVVSLIVWMLLKRLISNDINALAGNRPLTTGIPHHGMMIFVGCKFLLALGLWFAQVFATLYLKMETGAVVFGIANCITNFMLIGCIYIMCRVEKDFISTIE